MNFKSISLLALLTIPFAAQAQVAFTGQNSPNSNAPLSMPAWSVVTTGGDVTATIRGFDFNGSPGYSQNSIYAGTSVGTLQLVGTNYQFGTSLDLGPFAAGQEIVVAMQSQEGFWSYTGGASALNPDGHNHADLYNAPAGTIVDFEDEAADHADWNYGDASVSLTGTMATPEPMPFAVFGVGIIGLVIRRRK